MAARHRLLLGGALCLRCCECLRALPPILMPVRRQIAPSMTVALSVTSEWDRQPLGARLGPLLHSAKNRALGRANSIVMLCPEHSAVRPRMRIRRWFV